MNIKKFLVSWIINNKLFPTPTLSLAVRDPFFPGQEESLLQVWALAYSTLERERRHWRLRSHRSGDFRSDQFKLLAFLLQTVFTVWATTQPSTWSCRCLGNKYANGIKGASLHSYLRIGAWALPLPSCVTASSQLWMSAGHNRGYFAGCRD